MARLPRLRRPHLRQRPINASTRPLSTTVAASSNATEERPAVAEPAPPPRVSPTPAPPQEAKTSAETGARRRGLRLPRRPKLPSPRLPRVRPPRWLQLLLGGVAVAAVTVLVLALAGAFDVEQEASPVSAPAPTPSQPPAGAEPAAAETAAELGFPAFATKNTTRVGGTDPVAVAAGVALATFPSAGGAEPPEAVTLVGEGDWAGGVAAAGLMAEPLRAPILLSSDDGVPEETEQALSALAPEGGGETQGAQVFAIGDVDVPAGLETRRVGGGGPAAVAARIERLRAELIGQEPEHILIAPSGAPAFAMPAAAWAARSGDPVLFANENRLPKPTEAVLERHEDVPVYVLGPSSAISSDVVRAIGRLGGPVKRVSGEDPVTNAIALARYADGSFGWNINDPGHGLVVARSDRPLDAAAAAALSASGTWGPLLLTDRADTLPGALRGYLLDIKPGYRSDPTRAFYNHVWVIGDEEAIDVSQQAAIDDLAELAAIGGATAAEPEEPPRSQATDDNDRADQ